MRSERQVVDPRARGFDVICAGEALWKLEERDAPFAIEPTLRLRPGGGAVNAALTLARQGLHVGLATVLGDDSFGRALLA
ncbi:MAG: PfkB family carbohydrate kinase, partial [Polyangiaceae bacterium]